MSSTRAYVVLMATAISLTGMVAPKVAHATVQTPQYISGASKETVTAISPDRQTDSEAALAPAWTATRLEDAEGFTEAAIAADPNPLQQVASDKQVPEAAINAPDRSASRTKIPEPTTLILFGTALIGIGYAARKRMKR